VQSCIGVETGSRSTTLSKGLSIDQRLSAATADSHAYACKTILSSKVRAFEIILVWCVVVLPAVVARA
jgi:hypothetical protein